TFAQVYVDLVPALPQSTASLHILTESANEATIAGTLTRNDQFDHITEGASEMSAMYELSGAISGPASLADIGDAVADCLRRLVSFSLFVVYLNETSTDDLGAVYAAGEGASIVKGLKIPKGRHLSGWVAANHQTIV